jgi:pantothenate kinase
MGNVIDLDALVDIIHQRSNGRRTLTAVAGPPGAGKSTFADQLVSRLNREAVGEAEVLPMDGYHFDDMVLKPRGLLPRKGAPETFDVPGFHQMLSRLKRNEEPEVAVPVFDRDLEIARAAARLIPKSVRNLVIEGNYLLLNRPPWSSIVSFFDTTVMMQVPEEILRQRLRERWRRYGLPPDQVEAKVEANDIPNGRLVLVESIDPEFIIIQKETNV